MEEKRTYLITLVTGWTPLNSAATGGHLGVVRLLLDQGADINAKTTDGETALKMARDNHHKKVEELLTARGAKEQRIGTIYAKVVAPSKGLLARNAFCSRRRNRITGETPALQNE